MNKTIYIGELALNVSLCADGHADTELSATTSLTIYARQTSGLILSTVSLKESAL